MSSETDAARLRPEHWLAALGALAMLVAVAFLPWYGVGEGKLAPVRIDASLLAQASEQPGVSPDVGPSNKADPFGNEPAQPGQFVPAPPRAPSVPDTLSAWKDAGALGILLNGVVIAVAFVTIGFTIAAAYGEREGRREIGMLAFLGLAAIAAVGLRMVERPDEIANYSFDATLETGIFVCLVGAIAVTLAGLSRLAARQTVPAAAPAGGDLTAR
jgi:hypothetical protein